MSETRKLRIFLCHASQDKPTVRDLYNRLAVKAWIDPWLDEEKLLPGQNWEMEIEKAVDESDAVIVCCSSASVSKEGYVQRELKYALDFALEKPDGTIFIIPLRLDECEIPRRLRSWQYADYFPESGRDKAFQRLLISLHSRANHLNIKSGDTQTLNPSLAPSAILDAKPIRRISTKVEGPCLIDTSGEVVNLPKKQQFTIGRFDATTDAGPDLDLLKWDERHTVSRKHAKMIFHSGKYFLQSPFEALNGTFVNGEKVERDMYELKDGDRISFAEVEFQFRFRSHKFT